MNRQKLQRYLSQYLVLFIVLIVSGCLDVEGVHLSIDLANKTGFMIYKGIASDSQTDKEIQDDFASLILDYYTGDELKKSGDMENLNITAKELSVSGNSLNGKIAFSFAKVEDVFKAFQIRTDEKGNRYMQLSDGDRYLRGNAKISKQEKTDSTPGHTIAQWPKDATMIEMEIETVSSQERKSTNLAPLWKDWVKSKPDMKKEKKK